MSKVVAGDDVEEAKVEVEYDEPTDEREIRDSSLTTTANLAPPALDPTTEASQIGVPEGASQLENTVADDLEKENNIGVKQIKMTVAADAPWKDRLWEGSFDTHFMFFSNLFAS